MYALATGSAKYFQTSILRLGVSPDTVGLDAAPLSTAMKLSHAVPVAKRRSPADQILYLQFVVVLGSALRPLTSIPPLDVKQRLVLLVLAQLEQALLSIPKLQPVALATLEMEIVEGMPWPPSARQQASVRFRQNTILLKSVKSFTVALERAPPETEGSAKYLGVARRTVMELARRMLTVW